MELFQRKVLLHAVLFTTTLLITLQLSCCTTSCSSIGSPGCVCTCTSTTSSFTTSTTSSTTSTSISSASQTSSSPSTTSSTTSSTRETSTTSVITSSSAATSSSSSLSTSSTRSTTSSARTTTIPSTSSQSPPTENDQGDSEIDSRTPEPSITTQNTQDDESNNNTTDDDSSSPSTGRNNEQDENDNNNSGSNNNNDDNNADGFSNNDGNNTEYNRSVPTLSSDTATEVAENNWNETDALNGTAFLIVEGSTKKVISIVLPLICCIVFVIILIIFLAKKYKKKTKFRNHIESQVTYDLEEDCDNTKAGDLGQGFSHGDTIAVVAENLKSDNRRRSEQEKVLSLEGSVAQVFSGNGQGLSNVGNNKKLISGNGSGTNFLQEHAQMNESGKRLSCRKNKKKLVSGNGIWANCPHTLMNESGNGLLCDEKKKKLVSGNGSGEDIPKEHAQMNGSGLLGTEEGKPIKDPKPVAWDESNKSSNQIASKKEYLKVMHHEKHATLLDDIPDLDEIPVVADEHDIEEIKTKLKQASDSKETKCKFEEKERKDKTLRPNSKAPVIHLSAADVKELEKLKSREKNSTKMLKKLRSVLNMVIAEEDIVEDENAKRITDDVDDSKPHIVTKVDLKKSQMEINSFLDTLYLDEKEDSQEDIKAKNSTTKLDTENEDTENESLCSWDSDTEDEKEIADFFLKEEKINKTNRERKSPDGAEMEIPIDNSLYKAYILWLIWCKERCTCGAFLENPFGKDSRAIENELMRNAEEYVNGDFPYKREFAFRLQNSDRHKMSLKSFVNKNVKRDPLEKTERTNKTRQSSGTDEIDISGRIIEAVHNAQKKTSPDHRHEIKSAKESRGQKKSVEDVDKEANESITGGKGGDKKTKRQSKTNKKNTKGKDFDSSQKSVRKVNVSEYSDGMYGSADMRRVKQTAEHKDSSCKNYRNAECDLSEENHTATESSSSDTQNDVVAIDVVQSDSDDENDILQAGRSNPVLKRNHVDYIIGSDDEDNFIVMRSPTTECPAKVKSQWNQNTNKMSGRSIPKVVDEKIEKADVSPPKTSVSFERSRSLSKFQLDKIDESKKGNIPNKIETKTVSVPFKSELEVEARRKPRGIRQLSSECENITEDTDRNEYNEGKTNVGKGTRKRSSQFKAHGIDNGKSMQRGQDDPGINKREHSSEALDSSDDVVVSGTYMPSFGYSASNGNLSASTSGISNTDDYKQNTRSIIVGEAAKDQFEKVSVLAQERAKGQTGGRKTPSRRSARNRADKRELLQLFPSEWKLNEDELSSNREVLKSGGRRSSEISESSLTSRGFNIGNITVVDDRKYPIETMAKRLRNSNENKNTGEDDIDVDNDDDDDALYFAGGKVLNENIQKYEVAQAIPETYGKATVIRHGKKIVSLDQT